ncbi:dTMP kinase [Heliorestis acidaminivorans]|uniref:Thymidylate kinase n=1 Tax=Heliorestis acidaminivorans TaxID=553427 RepID=A0A6I0ERL6_9FIRM|nr:dTMP kinase [Heliorestis acidaminivorans]KAB2953009.1 dTMP kinase [Heliorestis acidaminivorans]
MKGILLTFEGADGAGKTTQLELLATFFQSRGREVIKTREPGGTVVSESIRQLLLDPAMHSMVSSTELLLYEAARAQLVSEVIKPALESGKVVLCDRFTDSTLAYQGYGRGLDRKIIEKLNDLATGGLKPDKTILLDLHPELGLQRVQLKRGADRLEQEDLLFHLRVREGFLDIADQDRARFIVISAEEDAQQVHQKIVEALQE